MVSLLNGLSALGAGEAQFANSAGLEAQKAGLAQQSLQLADQLQGARETAGRAQAGDIAAAAAAKEQQFQAGQGDLQRQTAVQVAQTGAGATLGAAGIQAAASEYNTRLTVNEDPPEVKLLKELGVITGGGSGSAAAAPSGGGGSSAPTPASSGGSAGAGSGASASGSSSSAANGKTAPAPASSPASQGGSAAPVSGASPLANVAPGALPIINKAVGLPELGSEADLAYKVANDVNNDPLFKDSTPGQRAIETQARIAVAQGKMIDPTARSVMATGIANYQVAPLEGRALSMPGANETMAQVLKINPDYEAARYPEVTKAFAAFGSGPQGDIIRSDNVAVQHLALLDQAAAALQNGGPKGLNALGNAFWTQLGYPAQTTFEGLKQIVGTEVEKATSGGVGAAGDRDRIMQSLSSANSPEQLLAMTAGFRTLMVGQLSGLKSQYEDATGIKTGPFAFEHKLDPATVKALSAPPAAIPAAPPTDLSATQMYGGTSASKARPAPAAGAPAAPAAPPAGLQSIWGNSPNAP